MKLRTIDAMLWKTGNSCVVTIPYEIVEKLDLKSGDILTINISK